MTHPRLSICCRLPVGAEDSARQAKEMLLDHCFSVSTHIRVLHYGHETSHQDESIQDQIKLENTGEAGRVRVSDLFSFWCLCWPTLQTCAVLMSLPYFVTIFIYQSLSCLWTVAWWGGAPWQETVHLWKVTFGQIPKADFIFIIPIKESQQEDISIYRIKC